MPKQPKRAVKVLKNLIEIKELLKFYIGEDRFSDELKKSFKDIEDYIKEISENQKDHDRRLWNKFKSIAGLDDDSDS